MSNHNGQTNTALAEAFTRRLGQLGLSRREFARRSGLSRQTIHHIENDNRTDLAPATFAALDETLRWPTGMAYALAKGEPLQQTESDVDRATKLRWAIIERIATLSIEDLEAMVYQWADDTR